MRKFGFVALALVAMGLMAGTSRASISGSAHDFGGATWSQNQICLPCHAPHHTIVTDTQGNKVGGPLWNHTLSTATYMLYDDWQDPTAAPSAGNVDQNSKLCLSCHDGTVALDSFGGATGNTFIDKNSGAYIGTDLYKSHPIGEAAKWPTPNPSYMVDPSLRDAKRIMPLRKLTTGELAVGCTSCHEPHNRGNTSDLLWVNNSGPGTTVDGRSVSGSTLCMNCHKK